ncbi:hypothetical protein FHX42_005319 [Saccharopolyspora lacisalsi]|uniref:Uncharacterized protein n=1 Tax=Halosaccharopolyspora lacisalsi TaxID=1000566 RepID=A0A839E144_9PSEU|nr:hypothetical protein [Halosaccharopolyspora lacisalsi]MBA8827912.1 hypothetical protein [Halosaccharopolyspora lacisalsi]
MAKYGASGSLHPERAARRAQARAQRPRGAPGGSAGGTAEVVTASWRIAENEAGDLVAVHTSGVVRVIAPAPDSDERESGKDG